MVTSGIRAGGQVQAEDRVLTSATSARDLDTNESLEFPSSRLGPSREVPLWVPTGVGSIFRPFSEEMKLAAKKRRVKP